jgi:hypothetical protein
VSPPPPGLALSRFRARNGHVAGSDRPSHLASTRSFGCLTTHCHTACATEGLGRITRVEQVDKTRGEKVARDSDGHVEAVSTAT